MKKVDWIQRNGGGEYELKAGEAEAAGFVRDWHGLTRIY